ncbi:mate-domain-containing protein [Mrakia frigida]|uniref:MATE family efflux transporter n=1 Tax=Mrakia frigida TaxID=29902 RepID=UPI003FCC18F4
MQDSFILYDPACTKAHLPFLPLLLSDAIVAEKAALYLRYLSIGIPGYAGNSIAKKYFQAQGLMNVPTVVILIVAPINIFLNWLLVYGPIDSIRLGFRGAPLATGLSMNLEFALFLLYGRLWSDSAAWPGMNWKKACKDLGTPLGLGISGIGMVASEWWSWEIVTLAASMLGAMALATQSILLISCSITYQIPFSLSIATAVRSGNLLGAGRGWEAKWTAWVALGLSIVISVFNSTILLIVRQRWALLFNEDEEVRIEVARILPYVAFFQLADGLTGVAGGILRVVGKQTLGAALNLSSYYILGLPVGIYLCFEKHFGIRGLWIGLSIALCYSSVLCNYIVFRTDWDREVLRAQDRLGLGGGKEEEERRPLLMNEEITEEEEEEGVAGNGERS